MKRKLLSIILIFCMALSIISTTAVAVDTDTPQYSDTTGHWAQAAIQRWSELGVLKGSGGKFRPNDPISRAELAAIINRILLFPMSSENLFSDMAGKWYAIDVNAVAMQSIYIIPKGAALGDQALTREEAVEMLYRTFMTDDIFSVRGKTVEFTDITKASPEYATAIKAFQQLRFISGYPDGSFHPQEPFTRAQVVTILNNIIGIYIKEPGVYDAPEGSNVCIAAPGVTVKGKNIHYISVLPKAADGMTVLQEQPEYGMVWGRHNYRNSEHFKLEGYGGSTINFKRIRVDTDHFFAGGTGRECDPYLIETEAQLRKLEEYISKDFEGYFFKLTKDIILSAEWIPIGHKAGANGKDISYDDIFWGELDGNDHTISNINISHKGDDISYFGLFSYLGGAVKNLTVNGTITVQSSETIAPDAPYGISAGGIAGGADANAIIDNCRTQMTIDIKGAGDSRAGGIVGFLGDASISNCTASGRLTVSSGSDMQNKSANAGGIAGTLDASGRARIFDCYSDVAVTAIGGYYSHAGGICGVALGWSTVERCFSYGTIVAKDSLMQNSAGGIAGQIEKQSTGIRECGSVADVFASGDPGYFNAAGGLVGAAYTNSSITNSYSAGTVSANGIASIGGLVGRAECRITTCYTAVKITADRALGNPAINGIVGTVRNFVVVKGCGVFNVSEPHFISFDENNNISIINTVGNKSLSDASTYRELGNLTHSSGGANWNFDSVWTFAVNESYSFPILQEIPAHLQKAK